MMKLIKKLYYEFFHNTSLKKKLLISYFSLTIVPLVIIYFLTYGKLTNVLKDNIYYSASQSFEQTFSFLSYKFYKVIRSSDVIVLDNLVHTTLNKDTKDYPFFEQVSDMNNLRIFLSSFEDKNDIARVRLYVKNGLIYSDENTNLFNADKHTDTIWYNKLMAEKSNILFCPSQYISEDIDSDNFLSIARTITAINNYSDLKGLLRIDIEKENILDIISKANPFENSFTFIQNSEGDLVVSSSHTLQEKYKVSTKSIVDQVGYTDNFEAIYMNGLQLYANSRSIPNTDWHMTTVIPYYEISREIRAQRKGLLLIGIILSIVVYALAYLVSYAINKRINILVSSMNNVYHGNLELIEHTDDKDEIGAIIKNYNYMLSRITYLMEEQYISGQKLKSAELKAIQAQINPHFLYNTLEMINWMARSHKTSDILTVTKALSNFYKLSLNKGKDFITIKDELQHVQSYVDIQNMRFENKIKYSTTVDEDIMHFIVPKIILQPLVENAIIHGILEKDTQEGVLKINVYKEEDSIFIEVEDNGIGIEDNLLKNIFSTNSYSSSDSGSHYGLKNIYDRLNLMYNKNCDMQFFSKIGIGTTVQIRIPYNNVIVKD